MLEQKETKKTPRLAIVALMAAGLAVVMIFTFTPWHYIPAEVTEDITVIAVTEHGCVGESQFGTSVVVPQCSAQVGDIVSATYNVPYGELNGYYERLQDRVSMVNP